MSSLCGERGHDRLRICTLHDLASKYQQNIYQGTRLSSHRTLFTLFLLSMLYLQGKVLRKIPPISQTKAELLSIYSLQIDTPIKFESTVELTLNLLVSRHSFPNMPEYVDEISYQNKRGAKITRKPLPCCSHAGSARPKSAITISWSKSGLYTFPEWQPNRT